MATIIMAAARAAVTITAAMAVMAVMAVITTMAAVPTPASACTDRPGARRRRKSLNAEVAEKARRTLRRAVPSASSRVSSASSALRLFGVDTFWRRRRRSALRAGADVGPDGVVLHAHRRPAAAGHRHVGVGGEAGLEVALAGHVQLGRDAVVGAVAVDHEAAG